MHFLLDEHTMQQKIFLLSLKCIFIKINKINYVWATAKVKVMEDGAQLADATVTGHWEEETGPVSGTTGKSGTVSFTSVKLIQSTEQQTFTFVVDSVTIGDVNFTLSGQTTNTIMK